MHGLTVYNDEPSKNFCGCILKIVSVKVELQENSKGSWLTNISWLQQQAVADVDKVSLLSTPATLLCPYGVAVDRMRGTDADVRGFPLRGCGDVGGHAGVRPVAGQQDGEGGPSSAPVQGLVKSLGCSSGRHLEQEEEEVRRDKLGAKSQNVRYVVSVQLF